MWMLFVAALFVFTSAQSLSAQFPSDVAVGSRVRVVLRDSLRQQWGPSTQWLRGDVAVLSRDTLYLRMPGTEAPVPIRHASIRRLDRSLGLPSRPESALRGAFAGAVWGAIYLSLIHYANERSGRSDAFWDDVGEGAAIGSGIGFVIGAIFPTERWRRVRLR
jgi:hypothetical protein